MKLISPTTYQGGKQRIAAEIINIINPNFNENFHDLCCGSGAISLELLNRGFPKENLYMADIGVWGIFWKEIGQGTFDLSKFKQYCSDLPKDVSKIQAFIKELSTQPASIDTSSVYLLLQAASFGGKCIWIENNKWMNTSFRSYWLPTETSNRRSPVNPMMPMPNTLYDRTALIAEKMVGIHGYCVDVREYTVNGGTVYIDPPYANTTRYGTAFDVMGYVKKINFPCYISEGKKLTENAIKVCEHRKKGGISGERKSEFEEWLNIKDTLQDERYI